MEKEFTLEQRGEICRQFDQFIVKLNSFSTDKETDQSITIQDFDKRLKFLLVLSIKIDKLQSIFDVLVDEVIRSKLSYFICCYKLFFSFEAVKHGSFLRWKIEDVSEVDLRLFLFLKVNKIDNLDSFSCDKTSFSSETIEKKQQLHDGVEMTLKRVEKNLSFLKQSFECYTDKQKNETKGLNNCLERLSFVLDSKDLIQEINLIGLQVFRHSIDRLCSLVESSLNLEAENHSKVAITRKSIDEVDYHSFINFEKIGFKWTEELYPLLSHQRPSDHRSLEVGECVMQHVFKKVNNFLQLVEQCEHYLSSRETFLGRLQCEGWDVNVIRLTHYANLLKEFSESKLEPTDFLDSYNFHSSFPSYNLSNHHTSPFTTIYYSLLVGSFEIGRMSNSTNLLLKDFAKQWEVREQIKSFLGPQLVKFHQI